MYAVVADSENGTDGTHIRFAGVIGIAQFHGAQLIFAAVACLSGVEYISCGEGNNHLPSI